MPDNGNYNKKEKYESKSEKYNLFKLPILRGMLSYWIFDHGDSNTNLFCKFYEDEEEEEEKGGECIWSSKKRHRSVAMGLTVATQ